MEQLHDIETRGFASDNYAGTHPEVLTALTLANGGHVPAYGDDPYTAALRARFREMLGEQTLVFPVFNGTGANVVGIQSLLTRWGGVIAPAIAHVNTDEGGAPEKVGGFKIIPVPTPDAKLTPELIRAHAGSRGVHTIVPQVVSITQSTELGTLYSPDEIRAITDTAHELGLAVHVDGARIANAIAALGVSLKEALPGVDVLSFGGTKIGALGAEAIVVLDPSRVTGVEFLQKNTMQLASKMRFVSAQLLALLEDDLWIRAGAQANAMAARLRKGVAEIPGISFTQETESNGVFAILPPGVADKVREHMPFYDWNTATGEVRWLSSWDTTTTEVDRLTGLVSRYTRTV